MIGMAGDLPVYLYPDVSPSARAVDVIQILKGFASRLSNYKGAGHAGGEHGSVLPGRCVRGSAHDPNPRSGQPSDHLPGSGTRQ